MNKRVRAALALTGLVCLGGGITLGTGLLLRRRDTVVIQKRLDQLATEVSNQVHDRINTYEYGLRGARGLIIGTTTEKLDRQSFHRYALSRDPSREFPGSRGFGYIVRVPEKLESEFIRRAQTENRPGFSIRQLSPHSGERFVILYIEPEDQNREAIGLDIASEQFRRDAALEAIDSGEVSLTGPITLVQASGKPLSGFLMLLPVFRDETTPKTKEERVAATVGWTYTPIVIDEVLRTLQYQSDEYNLTLYDITGMNNDNNGISEAAGAPVGIQFFTSHPQSSADASIENTLDESLKRTVIISLYSRVWAVEVSATPVFLRQLNLQNPWVTAAGIGGLAVLTELLLLLLAQNWARKRQSIVEHERLAMLVENSSDAIIGQTCTGIISSWNRSAEKIFGYSAVEAIGRDFGALILPPGNAGEDQNCLASAIDGSEVSSYPTVCLNKQGATVDVSMTMAPIRAENSQVVGIIRTIRDIRAAKSFEAKLIALNNSLEQQVKERTLSLDERNRQLELTGNSLLKIIESAPYALIMIDCNSRIRVFNAMAERIFGYERGELLGQPIEALIPEHLRQKHSPMHESYLKDPQTRPMGAGRDLFARRRDGSVIQVEIGLSPLETPEGRNVIAAIIDITQRKERENLIQQFTAFQEAVLSYAGFAIIATAPSGTVTIFNPAAEQMLGYSSAEVVGKASPEIFHDRAEVEARARKLSEELGTEIQAGFETFVAKTRYGKGDEHEWTYIRKDGGRLSVLLKVSALFNSESEIIGYLGIAVDLTERNESARKLEAYSEHLGEMVKERTRELEEAQIKLLSQERLQQELRLAAEIQEILMPQTPPQTARYDIALFAKSARFVSGDIYDVVATDEDTVFLFLADISGKGIPAALMTSAAQTLFRQGIRRSRSPSDILTEIEEMLARDLGKSELFMTCQICRLDYRTGVVVYVNAGHTETLVYRTRPSAIEVFVPTSLPVGIEAPPNMENPGEQSLPVGPGDVLVFYSDGLTELTDSRGEQFGIERLKATIFRHPGGDSRQLMDIILAEIQSYSGDKEAEDDTSIIIVRVLPSTITEHWFLPPAQMDTIVSAVVNPCQGYGSVFAYELELLATELISNIFRHAYGFKFGTAIPADQVSLEIKTRLQLETNRILLDVFDQGQEFTAPENFSDPSQSSEFSEGGYGMSILSQLSDRVSYERLEDGINHWHVAKSRKEASS